MDGGTREIHVSLVDLVNLTNLFPSSENPSGATQDLELEYNSGGNLLNNSSADSAGRQFDLSTLVNSVRYDLKQSELRLDETNGTVPDMFRPSTFERGFLTSANVGIFLCSVGIFFNLLLLLMLCNSRKMRFHYLYSQIMSIALADIGFVIMVDSFTVYHELQKWELGADFCKTWMILDVALPSVALLALMLLNIDRVLFTYKTECYQHVMQNTSVHVLALLAPWCISCAVVCTLWLGFPAMEPLPGLCMYGIVKEANTISNCLTVFLPSVLILILLIFIFIAVIGEMPTASHFGSIQQQFSLPNNPRTQTNSSDNSVNGHSRTDLDRTRSVATTSLTSSTHARRQRRFVAALLAVDFVSLSITLPYSAYSMVSTDCRDVQSCDSLMTLFQTLAWMRSSVACFRPILFIFLTDIYQSMKRRFVRWYLGEQGLTREISSLNRREAQVLYTPARNDYITLTHVGTRSTCGFSCRNESTTTTSVMTPPQSPYIQQNSDFKPKKNGMLFSALFKDDNDGSFV